jgi:orotate phosphoribosyltransferase
MESVMMGETFRRNPNLAQAILELAREKRAVLDGDFTLASGKKSGHYWDGKRVTLDPMGAYLVGIAILDIVLQLDVDAIGGLEIGAIPIATAVALVSCQSGMQIPAFIVRKYPKEHGTRSEIEGYDPSGRRVVIVDDVITSGESIEKAIKAVEQRHCTVVRVITLVDRHEGGSDRIRALGYPFQSILDFQTIGGKTVLGVSATSSSGLEEKLLC